MDRGEIRRVVWDFDRHCTGNVPEKLTCRNLGAQSDTFIGTRTFQPFTDEALEIMRLIPQDSDFFRQMKNCRKFDDYLSEICGRRIEFLLNWPVSQIRNGPDPVTPATTTPWGYSRTTYDLCINLSNFPKNKEPKGGATCLRNADGTVMELNYREYGDAILIQGDKDGVEHCGQVAVNYSKTLFVFGLGLREYRTLYPAWCFVGRLNKSWTKEQVHAALTQQIAIKTFHLKEINETVKGRLIRNRGSCHVECHAIADRNRLVGANGSGPRFIWMDVGDTPHQVEIREIHPEKVNDDFGHEDR